MLFEKRVLPVRVVPETGQPSVFEKRTAEGISYSGLRQRAAGVIWVRKNPGLSVCRRLDRDFFHLRAGTLRVRRAVTGDSFFSGRESAGRTS